jgi:hypothetical protein
MDEDTAEAMKPKPTSRDSVGIIDDVVKLDVHLPWPNSGGRRLNSDVDWEQFDPDLYRDHNYLKLRKDDRQIMITIRDFFAAAGVSGGLGLDVGAGPNLYPSLAMLPFCRRLNLLEFSNSNVAWLKRQVEHFDPSWDDFWAVYRENPAYARIGDPRAAFAATAVPDRGNVFELPQHRWNLGTMFFVACSISTEIEEFHQAVACFVRALVPGAPFAAAFMEESEGYPAGDALFPAVGVHEKEVSESLARVAYDVTVARIEMTGEEKLRDGYSGAMIVACGRAGRLT